MKHILYVSSIINSWNHPTYPETYISTIVIAVLQGTLSPEALSSLAELTWLVSWVVEPRSKPRGSHIASHKHSLEKVLCDDHNYYRACIFNGFLFAVTQSTLLETLLQAAKVCHEAGLLVTTNAGAAGRLGWCCLTQMSLSIISPGAPCRPGHPYEPLSSPSCLHWK